MEKVWICKTCKKPGSRRVKGKALKGKKILQALEKENLSFEVVACSCLGKCKKGPNGMIMPGKKRIHRLSVKKLIKLNEKNREG
jgi:NADH:ubiquinone oxidoreductase subunit E